MPSSNEQQLEGKNILYNLRILFGGDSAWSDPGEQQIMFEKLATGNEVIWANPFGPISGAIIPRISRVKDGLTVYNPGMNLLPLPLMGGFNQRRRLLQVIFYLLERDFEPELVWIDSPGAVGVARHYGKKGTLALYYADEDNESNVSRTERKKVAAAVNLIVTPSERLFREYKNYKEKTFLLEGGILEMPPDDEEEDDEGVPEEMLEQALLEDINKRLNEITSIVERELFQGKGSPDTLSSPDKV